MISTLDAARQRMAGVSAIILSDGKAGDEAQCLGLAERLGLAAEIRRVRPTGPFAWFAPHFGIDPRDAPTRSGSPLAAPHPDLAIASGRRTIAYLRALKAASGGRTFTAFLKDPRTGTGTADMIWVPAHDGLRGENVVVTLTAPHRVSPERLMAERAAPPLWLTSLPAPRVALILGGDSRHHRFTPADAGRLAAMVRGLMASGASLMATASRRTPPALAGSVRRMIEGRSGLFWDGMGENPYPAMLANADAIVVTADSTNMVGEAVASGRPVLVFSPSGGSRKIARYLRQLEDVGAIRPFNGLVETYTYEPIDATPVIAIELARRYETFQMRRARSAGGSAG